MNNKYIIPAYLFKIYCLIMVILLSACNPAPDLPLRIGTNTFPGYEPLYLARSLGYYENTQVNLIELTSASEVIHALRSGTLEGATLTLDETLTLLADDIDLQVILVMDFSNGADVLLAKPEFTSMAQLREKRIAVEYTAVGAILLDAALASAGLTASDVEIVSCLLDNHINCYHANDAVVTFEPVRTKLLAQGAKLLFDSSKIPQRIVDVLVVHKSSIENHSRSLKDLISGYFKAHNYLKDKPEDASILMALRQGIKPEEVLESYKGIKLLYLNDNYNLLTGTPPKLHTSTVALVEYMLERKLLRKTLNVNNIINEKFLPPLKP